MKSLLSLTKESLKEIYYLISNHWKKIMELSALFIIISVVLSVFTSYFIAQAGTFFYIEFEPEIIFNYLGSTEVYHIEEISSSIYTVNIAIFAVFLLKYKENIPNTKIKHVLQLKDTKLYTNWFFGLIVIVASELIFYIDLIDTSNYYYGGIAGPFYAPDTISNNIQFHSWANSITNLIQWVIPIIVAILIVFSSLKEKINTLKLKNIALPILSTFFLFYCSSIFVDSIIFDVDTYLFRLIGIPFSTPWIYYVLTFAFTLILISFLFAFIAGSISIPLSKFLSVDITDKAEKTSPAEDEEILDSIDP